jgi:hypothetical protein
MIMSLFESNWAETKRQLLLEADLGRSPNAKKKRLMTMTYNHQTGEVTCLIVNGKDEG